MKAPLPGNFSYGCFFQHIQDKLQRCHIITEIFFFQAFEIFVLPAGHAKPGPRDLVRKVKLRLSLIGSFCISMLFVIMLPMLTPLDAAIINVSLRLMDGVLFSAGFGAVSSTIRKKTSLVQWGLCLQNQTRK